MFIFNLLLFFTFFPFTILSLNNLFSKPFIKIFKTKAIQAPKINGEIVSCDSMQIYKEMDIGTAKPTRDELFSVPHHLIDIRNPNENFSCADYQILAKNI